MNLKFILGTMSAILISSQVMAASDASKDRGASCTDYCTRGGKNYIEKGAAFLADKERINDEKNLEDLTIYFNKQCKKLDAAGLKNSDNAGNVNWCEKNCTGKGGLVSQLKKRRRDVGNFLQKRKADCQMAAKNFSTEFKGYKYDWDTGTIDNVGLKD